MTWLNDYAQWNKGETLCSITKQKGKPLLFTNLGDVWSRARKKWEVFVRSQDVRNERNIRSFVGPW